MNIGSYSHSCGTKVDGTLWCWGNNAYGQLGDGTDTSRTTPTYVDAGTTWTSVSAGGVHSCGITDGGTAWCWGQNYPNGQLGDGTTDDKWTPTYVDAGMTWGNVSAGYSHTCGTKVDGTLWCWGQNLYGQLGDGTTVDKKVPTYVDAGATWANVKLGFMDTCGRKGDGTIWCWGSNYQNVPTQVGD
jgi:alpha-tubulin suppressor-like RCC1 family protein